MRDHEKPVFEKRGGWCATTRHGMVWRLFPDDERQLNLDIYNEALEAVQEIIDTGKPLCGGWR